MAARKSAILPKLRRFVDPGRQCSKTSPYWLRVKESLSNWSEHSHSQGRQARRAKHAPDKTSFRREKYNLIVRNSITA
jgi:hypothetical protein